MKYVITIVILIFTGCDSSGDSASPVMQDEKQTKSVLSLDEQYATHLDAGIKSIMGDENTGAIEHLTKALKLKETSEAYGSRGFAYHHSGEFKLAIADYNKAVELGPEDFQALHNRSKLYYDTGDYLNSLADCNRVIELAPEHGVAHYFRGLTHRKLGEYGRAQEDFQDAIGILLHDNEEILASEVFNSLAWQAATCPDDSFRNGPKALELAEAACKVSKKHWHHLDTLAAAYAETSDFDKAEETQQKAIETAPEDQRAEMQERLKLYQSDKPYRTQGVKPVE